MCRQLNSAAPERHGLNGPAVVAIGNNVVVRCDIDTLHHENGAVCSRENWTVILKNDVLLHREAWREVVRWYVTPPKLIILWLRRAQATVGRGNVR